ncbi:MAG TPA: UDP-N-acetylglucosamine--N-acetylmuramyl-(pentapeptide) pyrophosphoryl-undecaprenol N-acetylglucosamine transferase [Candidatus Sulfotelmatobacter sp.]|jgi:UDP-N-acetylglucosamine--N-acetylmuramyl-(pentapeptide) pyrophosphoryl-undecaprenol N-acetylglucosamine transferase|nr:UDP-N-acetylglucosamine--N-acetylmuramyl-(pentapeptide) pyrophosphoryl-undecaprenol N-acetylglucosamine transferase [Candidatus Sulfotelmatobacter sp.]
MKVLIAVGGGGHFSPALAVIEKMPKDWDILLVGRKYAFEGDQTLSFEYRTAHRLGLPFVSLTTGRLQRKFTRYTFASLIKVPVGLTQSMKILRRYQPDIVLSFGGYVSFPVVIAAAILHIPIVIHEQILHAGLANKVAARFATKICISWRESQHYFPKGKTILTGNPLRKEFFSVKNKDNGQETRKYDNNLPLIYITGGSGGAHGINLLIEGCLEKLLENYTVIHQTGDAKEFGDYARLEKLKRHLPAILQKRYILQKFIEPERIMDILNNADLVISRSGINSVTELLYLGKPSLLIPLPYGQHNEQLTNALFVKSFGLAEVIDQRIATSATVLQKITNMISNLDFYASHKQETRALIKIDATEKILEEVRDAKEKRISA